MEPRSASPRRQSIEWPGETLRIVAVADTHSRPHPESTRHIAAQKPDRILHAGDIGDLRVLDELEKIAPVFAVRGNIDTPVASIPETLTVDIVERDRSLFKLLLTHIAVYGPKLRREVAELAHSEKAALVVCGHSHVPFIGKDKGVGVFNPGSIGPRRFQLPIVFGVIEIAKKGVSLRHVDCETGATWQP
jgi:putative phosphoesterase